MGKKDPKKMIKAADLMPIPNQKMAMGIQARGGMGRTISTSGLKSSRSTLDQPMNMPSVTAKMTASKKPENTR
jgi:hypothetical protein